RANPSRLGRRRPPWRAPKMWSPVGLWAMLPHRSAGMTPNLEEDTMSTFSGRCSCGAVSYQLASAPMFVHCCHCLDCQRQTGSAFVLNALIEADRVEVLSGETQGFPQPTDSGRPHIIHRCPKCGTAMWSTYGGLTAIRFVRVGTLE